MQECTRISSAEIANNLQDVEYEITERVIRYRLGRLEKNNIILGYSAILNPGLMIQKSKPYNYT